MKRHAFTELKQWKRAKNRKPLLLQGTRQVGKTWLMKEFGAQEYKQVLYVNFERDKHLQNIFKENFDTERILTILQVHSKLSITKDTLIIFDEIQEAEGAVTSLKYFYEESPEYHIIGAGSLLGVTLNGKSFPVGKVEFLNLYPMTFYEYIEAIGEENLLQIIQNQEWDIIKNFHQQIITHLKHYYFIGGMPEAVASFIKEGDFEKVKKIQKDIVNAYKLDFSKHAPHQIIPKIHNIWNSLPSQLSKENKKFIYGLVKKGARAREYEDALNWLEDYGLIHRVYRITKPHLPLSFYEDVKAFKIYAHDIGILGALSEIDIDTILYKNLLFTEFKGALTEQYVLQQLIGHLNASPKYWSSDSSTNEVDFIFHYRQHLYPIEVKAEDNLQSKSLKFYHQRFAPKQCVRTSLAPYRIEEWLINIPLYAISEIENQLQ